MRLRNFAPALAVVSLGAPLAQAQDASFDAVGTVRGALTDAAMFGATDATVGDVTREGDTVRASDVVLRWSYDFGTAEAPAAVAATITIPTLELTGFAPAGEDWSADRVAAPQVRFEAEGGEGSQQGRYAITFRDYVVTDAQWAKLPQIAQNPAAPVSRYAPLIAWSLDQSYASATVGGADAQIVTPEGPQEISYGAMEFGPTRDGVVERYSYGPTTTRQTLAMPDTAPDAEIGSTVPLESTMTYGGFRGTGLDIRPFAQLLTGVGDATGPAPISATMAGDEITGNFGDSVTVRIGPSEVTDITVDPTRGPLLNAIDGFILSAQNGAEPSPDEIIGFLLDIYGAFGIGRYTLGEIDATFPGGSAKVGGIVIEDYSGAGLGRFAISGLDMTAEGTSGRFGSIEIGDLVFPSRDAFMAAVMGSMAGMQPDYQTFVSAMPQLGRVAVDGLTFTNPAMGTFEIGRFETTLQSYLNGLPTRSRIALDNFSMPVAMLANPMVDMIAGQLGLSEIDANGQIALTFDEDSERVELDSDVTVAGVGQLRASAALSGIPRFVIEEPQRAQEAAATAAIVGVNANFRDEGVTGVLLDMVAAQSGVSRADFIAGIAAQVGTQVSMLTGDPAFAEQLSDTIATFLGEPGSLDIAVNPANAVPVAQLVGAAMTAPQTLPRLLNLSVTANR